MKVKTAKLVIAAIQEQPSWSAQLLWGPWDKAYAVLAVTTGGRGYVIRCKSDALRLLAGQRGELTALPAAAGTANCGYRRGLYSSPCGT